MLSFTKVAPIHISSLFIISLPENINEVSISSRATASKSFLCLEEKGIIYVKEKRTKYANA
jgi:hypothetical protein